MSKLKPPELPLEPTDSAKASLAAQLTVRRRPSASHFGEHLRRRDGHYYVPWFLLPVCDVGYLRHNAAAGVALRIRAPLLKLEPVANLEIAIIVSPNLESLPACADSLKVFGPCF